MTQNKRPPEPEYIRLWREWIANGPPRCCHTCENYGVFGQCYVFNMEPPPEFAAKIDQCEKWEQELPF